MAESKRRPYARISYKSDLPGAQRAQNLLNNALRTNPLCKEMTISLEKDNNQIVIYVPYNRSDPVRNAVEDAINRLKSNSNQKGGCFTIKEVDFSSIKEEHSPHRIDERAVESQMVIKGLRKQKEEYENEITRLFSENQSLTEKNQLLEERLKQETAVGEDLKQKYARAQVELKNLQSMPQQKTANDAHDAIITYMVTVANNISSADNIIARKENHDRQQREIAKTRAELAKLGLPVADKSLEAIVSEIDNPNLQGVINGAYDKENAELQKRYCEAREQLANEEGDMKKIDSLATDKKTREKIKKQFVNAINEAKKTIERYETQKKKIIDSRMESITRYTEDLMKIIEQGKNSSPAPEFIRNFPIYVAIMKDENQRDSIKIYLPIKGDQRQSMSKIVSPIEKSIAAMKKLLSKENIEAFEQKLDSKTGLQTYSATITRVPETQKKMRRIREIVESSLVRGYKRTGLEGIGTPLEILYRCGFYNEYGIYCNLAKEGTSNKRVSLSEKKRRIQKILEKREMTIRELIKETRLGYTSIFESLKALKNEGRVIVVDRTKRAHVYGLKKEQNNQSS